MYRADTIVACATAAGRSAIAIVRCSGRDAPKVARAVFHPKTPGPIEPWRMRLGTVIAADGVTPLDEALGVHFPAAQSYTGEETFEIHCHGSPVVVEQILASAIAAGARAAERGEFTRRAVLNGKMDLLQAEAVADLIDSRMLGGAAAAWKQLQGALSEQLDSIRRELLAVLAGIEADVDFTDDELPATDFEARGAQLDAARSRLEGLLRGFAASRRQREGVRVVFAGRPNAGKSSLVNRLLGSPRMIVSEEAGTTRDAVDEEIDLGGLSFVLTDTAGLRDGTGAAEGLAVERARERIGDADLRVVVIDASLAPAAGEESLWRPLLGPDTIVALNKIDLGVYAARPWWRQLGGGGAVVVECSARTGRGCEELRLALLAAARRCSGGQAAGISRVRHRAAIERALEPLRRASELAGSEQACELAAIELRGALAELASIAGAVDNEEVLDRIFSEFCIGK